jgi:riboflavin synthase
MFTGIIRERGKIVSISNKGTMELVIELKKKLKKVKIGSSIAINGVCLTVTKISGSQYCFDVVEETLRCTNFASLKKGQAVHVEPSAQFGDEIGGHVLSGHISTIATCVSRESVGSSAVFVFSLEKKWIQYIVEKGFLALDGCSLTVHHINTKKHCFSFSCIPETLRSTHFQNLKKGDTVNVELDPSALLLVETVKNYLKKNKIHI